jgi:hypothetical protein
MYGAEKGKKNLEDRKIEPPKEIAFFILFLFIYMGDTIRTRPTI